MNRPDWRTIPCDDYPKAYANGYGAQSKYGENGAHRVAWHETHGPIPPGKWVLHRCHRRICREPSHLYLGNNKQNVADRQAAGRQARGENYGTAKLTNAQAADIKRRLASEPAVSLAREFGVSKACVSNINTGRSWSWLPTLATREAA